MTDFDEEMESNERSDHRRHQTFNDISLITKFIWIPISEVRMPIPEVRMTISIGSDDDFRGSDDDFDRFG